MSTLGTASLTLADWAKRLDPDGKVPTIVELLSQTNDILTDMRWIEGNLPTGHRTTVRTGLPSVAWRLLNGGVTPSKSNTAQIDEQCGMLEAWSEVDRDLVLLNGNSAAFRLSEAMAFIEAMNEEFAQTLFYGNVGLAPEEFTGLAARYSSTSAGNGSNVLLADASASGSDNSSIYLVVWGDNTVHGIFPKGSKAGLIHEDKGEQIVYSANSMGAARLLALVEHFQWKGGLALKDWRYVVRIANIDISRLVAFPTTFTSDLLLQMIKAYHRIPNINAGTAVFYCNRTIQEALHIQARQTVTTAGQLSYDVLEGKPIVKFMGIPIRRCDQLLETEVSVS